MRLEEPWCILVERGLMAEQWTGSGANVKPLWNSRDSQACSRKVKPRIPIEQDRWRGYSILEWYCA
jgi:hypothetical protein